MKFGPRLPSLKKTVKAHTTSKVKRSVKKSVNPLYGRKGMGWVNNPQKAVYNKVYNKTSFDMTGRSKPHSSASWLGLLSLFGFLQRAMKPAPPPVKSVHPRRPSPNKADAYFKEKPHILSIKTYASGVTLTYTLPPTTANEKDADRHTRLIANEPFLVFFLNEGTLDALTEVNGIGPARAQKIIAHRPYCDMDDALNKPNGYGEWLLYNTLSVCDEQGRDIANQHT